LLVIFSLITEAFNWYGKSRFDYYLEIMNVFRIFRIFKIIRKYKSLRIIFQTFFMSLSDMLHLGGLLLLFLFVFAILGVRLFSAVKI
jgi:hypothetical protein